MLGSCSVPQPQPQLHSFIRAYSQPCAMAPHILITDALEGLQLWSCC